MTQHIQMSDIQAVLDTMSAQIAAIEARVASLDQREGEPEAPPDLRSALHPNPTETDLLTRLHGSINDLNENMGELHRKLDLWFSPPPPPTVAQRIGMWMSAIGKRLAARPRRVYDTFDADTFDADQFAYEHEPRLRGLGSLE